MSGAPASSSTQKTEARTARRLGPCVRMRQAGCDRVVGVQHGVMSSLLSGYNDTSGDDDRVVCAAARWWEKGESATRPDANSRLQH